MMFGKSKDKDLQEVINRLDKLTREMQELRAQVIDLKNSQRKFSTRSDINALMIEIKDIKKIVTPPKKTCELAQDEILKVLKVHNHIPTCELIKLVGVSPPTFYKALKELEKTGKVERYDKGNKKIICLKRDINKVIERFMD